MTREFKNKQECLQIRWKRKNYYFDMFDANFFDEEMAEENREHEIFYDDEDPIIINCIASINGKHAILDYTDPQGDIYQGITYINFFNEKRSMVKSIDWANLDGEIFKDLATSNWPATDEAIEGERSFIESRFISRSASLALSRKEKDDFQCQACGFKLEVNGRYILDSHHIEKISSRSKGRLTSIDELVSLCPNCHRISHTSNPPLSIGEIKKLLTKPSTGIG